MERGPQDRHGGYEDMEMGRGKEMGRKFDCGSEILSPPSHTTVHKMNKT